MDNEDDALIDDAQGQAEFGSGFENKADKAPDKPAESAEAPREPEAKEPEYAKITLEEVAFLRAAAAKVTSLEAQQSKAFGTIGNLQKLMNEVRAQTPRGMHVPDSIINESFADMEKDFPELATQNKTALKRLLSNLTGTGAGEIDETKIRQLVAEDAAARAEEVAKREIEDLEDAYPDWRDIVGAVPDGQHPDPDHPYRKWLATKPEPYQKRINETLSSAVVARSIQRFKTETRAPAKPSPQPATNARAERIREAVQPKGDGAPSSSRDTSEDAFAAGFSSR